MRSFLTYLALVGVPVAGLFGILHAGRGLQAPPALGGEWTVAAAPSSTAPSSGAAACAAWGDSLARGGLSISQSGVHLSVTLRLGGERRVSAILRGDSLRSPAATAADASGGCDPARGVALAARVDAAAEPHRMAGELRFADCPSCAPVAFTAARAEAEPEEEGR